MKIQLDLTEEENLMVELYKLKYKLNTKQEAIKKMIKCFDIKLDIKWRGQIK